LSLEHTWNWYIQESCTQQFTWFPMEPVLLQETWRWQMTQVCMPITQLQWNGLTQMQHVQ